MYLLDNRFAPTTFGIGFLEAPLTMVSEACLSWLQGIGRPVKAIAVQGSLEELLPRLEPLLNTPRRELWIQTGSAWVAYFDNIIRRPDPGSPIGVLSQKIKCRGLIVRCIPHTRRSEAPGAKGVYRAVSFEIFLPEPRPGELLNTERWVGVVYDANRWVFHASGEIQPFESPERYKARRIVERFPPEMLVQYCSALGIRLVDPDFYGPNGVLIEDTRKLPPSEPSMTLAEARARIGFPP